MRNGMRRNGAVEGKTREKRWNGGKERPTRPRRHGSNKIQQKRRVNHVEICVHSMPCRYIVFAGWRIV